MGRGIRACTMRLCTLSVCHLFCKRNPVATQRRPIRRLARRQGRPVLPGRVDDLDAVVQPRPFEAMPWPDPAWRACRRFAHEIQVRSTMLLPQSPSP